MDASQAEQIKCAAPVWVWDAYWWPAVVVMSSAAADS